ncbi:MAG: PadR family transcriptional regulator [Oscillospiraceae bacterium]|nr:PadR family transcriptional regulator [Oscillospiraceae bacterium]
MAFQVTAPLLDGCVLAILEQGDAYGYNLTQQLRKEIDLSESTLYPVLRRLQKDGCLTVYDEQFQGRNRRYYAITPAGREQLAECRDRWRIYESKIDHILSGGMQDG